MKKLTKPLKVAPGKIKPIGTNVACVETNGEVLRVTRSKFRWLEANGYFTSKKRGKKPVETKESKIKVETKNKK